MSTPNLKEANIDSINLKDEFRNLQKNYYTLQQEINYIKNHYEKEIQTNRDEIKELKYQISLLKKEEQKTKPKLVLNLK